MLATKILVTCDNITPKNMPEKGNILFINPENNEFFNVTEKNEAKEVNGQDEVLSKYTDITKLKDGDAFSELNKHQICCKYIPKRKEKV